MSNPNKKQSLVYELGEEVLLFSNCGTYKNVPVVIAVIQSSAIAPYRVRGLSGEHPLIYGANENELKPMNKLQKVLT